MSFTSGSTAIAIKLCRQLGLAEHASKLESKMESESNSGYQQKRKVDSPVNISPKIARIDQVTSIPSIEKLLEVGDLSIHENQKTSEARMNNSEFECAIYAGNINLVFNFLIEYPENVSAKMIMSQKTPLDVAFSKNDRVMVGLLMDLGATVKDLGW